MESLENPAISSATPTPTGFYSQKLWGFIFLALEPWAVQSSLGLGSVTPNFYPPQVNVVWPITILPPSPLRSTLHLSASLHISSPPTRLDECGFFKSLVVGLSYSLIF